MQFLSQTENEVVIDFLFQSKPYLVFVLYFKMHLFFYLVMIVAN